MKKIISTVIIILILVIGLSFILYPTISNYVNQRSQSRVITSYKEQVGNLRDEEYSAILERAREYNRNHKVNNITASDEDAMTEDYLSQLSVDGGNIMGYLEIPKIGVWLGLYHGVEESVLQIGTGHLPQTSLPVGGEGTHAVISGHTGLPSAVLLTNVDQLEIGDTFTLYILNEVLTYEVDQIVTVLPEEVSELSIAENSDYLTIITCTPYGINSHRLLIRGTRIENPQEEETEIISEESVQTQPGWFRRTIDNLKTIIGNIAEAIARGLVDLVEWGMELFGIEYT